MYNKEEGQIVEVYAYQFGWITRYAGPDNKLGKAINVLKALAFFKKEIIDYNVIIFGASPAVKTYCSENEFWAKKALVYLHIGRGSRQLR